MINYKELKVGDSFYIIHNNGTRTYFIAKKIIKSEDGIYVDTNINVSIYFDDEQSKNAFFGSPPSDPITREHFKEIREKIANLRKELKDTQYKEQAIIHRKKELLQSIMKERRALYALGGEAQ